MQHRCYSASRSDRPPVRRGAAPQRRTRLRKPSTGAARQGRLLQRSSGWSIQSPNYFAGADDGGLKSTFGAVEISFSFSTEKFGFSLYPNAIAVRLVGNERTLTLSSRAALM